MNKKYTTEEVQEQLKQILIEKIGIEEKNIFPEAVFHIEMEMDSLEIVELFFYVEEHFTVTFLTTDEEKVDNFQKLINLVQKYLSQDQRYYESK